MPLQFRALGSSASASLLCLQSIKHRGLWEKGSFEKCGACELLEMQGVCAFHPPYFADVFTLSGPFSRSSALLHVSGHGFHAHIRMGPSFLSCEVMAFSMGQLTSKDPSNDHETTLLKAEQSDFAMMHLSPRRHAVLVNAVLCFTLAWFQSRPGDVTNI